MTDFDFKEVTIKTTNEVSMRFMDSVVGLLTGDCDGSTLYLTSEGLKDFIEKFLQTLYSNFGTFYSIEDYKNVNDNTVFVCFDSLVPNFYNIEKELQSIFQMWEHRNLTVYTVKDEPFIMTQLVNPSYVGYDLMLFEDVNIVFVFGTKKDHNRKIITYMVT